MRTTRRIALIAKRTLVAFYDDQMTQHAGALTYYALMSLFPLLLLGLSLLGLIGEYPSTYNAIIGYLRRVAPPEVVAPLDTSLRAALRHKSTAATALGLSVIVAFYGATGVLESCRRALNVVFEVRAGRSFLRRKAIDSLSTVVLLALSLASLVLVFVGGRFAEDLLGFVGLGATAAQVWSIARWPAAVLVAMVAFSYLYYVTPDVQHRAFRWITPGAVGGVLLWLGASYGFSLYISSISQATAVYGAFTGAIVLVVWLWLTSVALLLGAELNAEIERSKELDEGVPEEETLNRPPRTGR
jgi:membrane protein